MGEEKAIHNHFAAVKGKRPSTNILQQWMWEGRKQSTKNIEAVELNIYTTNICSGGGSGGERNSPSTSWSRRTRDERSSRGRLWGWPEHVAAYMYWLSSRHSLSQFPWHIWQWNTLSDYIIILNWLSLWSWVKTNWQSEKCTANWRWKSAQPSDNFVSINLFNTNKCVPICFNQYI